MLIGFQAPVSHFRRIPSEPFTRSAHLFPPLEPVHRLTVRAKSDCFWRKKVYRARGKEKTNNRKLPFFILSLLQVSLDFMFMWMIMET